MPNSTNSNVAVQGINKYLCFVSSLESEDSLALYNRPIRVLFIVIGNKKIVIKKNYV